MITAEKPGFAITRSQYFFKHIPTTVDMSEDEKEIEDSDEERQNIGDNEENVNHNADEQPILETISKKRTEDQTIIRVL